MEDAVSFARLIEALRPWLGHLVIVGGWAHRLHRLHPLAGNFDGDARGEDVAVWRASTGTWFWLATAYGQGSRQWGSQAMGDIPIIK